MALTESNFQSFGFSPDGFNLPNANGVPFEFNHEIQAKGLFIVFICNHCPYVVAIADRLKTLADDLKKIQIDTIAISSNDVETYPQDSFENMKIFAKERKFNFPYLYDETQKIAKMFNAQCTPDPYLFKKQNGRFELFYQGRLDDSWKEESQVKHREMFEIANLMLKNEKSPELWKPSMGCNIKWKK